MITTRSKGLSVLSKVSLTEAEQMEIILERSKTTQHISHASASGADEGIGKSNDDESEDDDANISKDDNDVADEDDDDNDDDERTELDNDGDDFVHLKLTTHDDEEMSDEEEKDEDSFYPRVHTPPTDDEAYNEETFGVNDEEAINEEVPVQEVSGDENVNLVGNEVEMTDAQANQDTKDDHVTLTAEPPVVQQQSSSVSSGFISNMLNPNPDTGIDSVLNIKTTSLVDVHVTTQAVITPSFATTLPPPPNPLIIPQQQTPVPTTINASFPSL
ncbi:hypothetical protein Tco_0625346 [Tanacetum coccineum]|uniref:Uncharacterized protein n=1 Tax=Tanacetum coccineum TaxID=301880 RepID=A0ABQ4WGK1_9ASTR